MSRRTCTQPLVLPGVATGPRPHGGAPEEELRALGIDPAAAVDFSVNTNPYGPCAAVVEAAGRASLDRYPHPTARAAREALARRCGVRPEEVVLGNGAAELLWSVARVLLRPGDRVLAMEPTFSELPAAAEAALAAVVHLAAKACDHFAIHLDDLARKLREARPRLAYVCCPNNPTGSAVRAEEMAAMSAGHPGTTFVIDQAFLSLSELWEDEAVTMPSNAVRVRSLTKELTIPGLRVGYLLGDAELCARIESGRPAWSTSSPAQAAALEACNQDAFVAESRRRMLEDRRELAAAFYGLKLRPFRTVTSFFVVPVPDAARIRSRLLRHGIVVRDCASFGMPRFIRIGARPREDRDRLLRALEQEL